jgi:hypothetical protein
VADDSRDAGHRGPESMAGAVSSKRGDAIEDALREHGYLDAGVERFLGRPGATRGRTLLGTVARAALIGGPALALAWTLIHLSVDTGLLREPARALRLGLVLGLLGTTFALAMGGLVSLLGRRAARTGRARAATCAAAIPVLVLVANHLTLRASGPPGIDDLVAGLVAVGLFGGLAWLFRLVAEIAAGAVGRIGPGRGLGMVAFFLALALALGLGAALAPTKFEAQGASSYSVVQTGHRVAWIQIDGLSPDLLDRLLEIETPGADAEAVFGQAEEGRDRAVAALAMPGAPVPPTAWTNAATGRGAAAHGVADVEGRRRRWGGRGWRADLWQALWPAALEVETLATSALLRRLPSMTEIAASKDYRVLSINAWCSGPGEVADGVSLISDRSLRGLLAGTQAPLSPEDVHPEPLRQALETRRAGLEAMPLERRKEELDGLVVALLDAALAEAEEAGQPDLIVVGLSSLDLLALGRDALRPEDEVEAGRRRDQLKTFAVRLARLVARLRDSHAVVISTGPGYANPSEDGVVVFEGGPFRAAPGLKIDLVDLAPTLLRVLGFPRARDFDGRVVERLFDPAFLRKFSPREIETYGDRRGAADGDDQLAAEQLDALRTLGYGGGPR